MESNKNGVSSGLTKNKGNKIALATFLSWGKDDIIGIKQKKLKGKRQLIKEKDLKSIFC